MNAPLAPVGNFPPPPGTAIQGSVPFAGTRAAPLFSPVGKVPGTIGRVAVGAGVPIAVRMAMGDRDTTSTPLGRMLGAIGEGASAGAPFDPRLGIGTGITAGVGQGTLELNRVAEDENRSLLERGGALLGRAGLSTNQFTGGIAAATDIINNATGGEATDWIKMIPGFEAMGIDTLAGSGDTAAAEQPTGPVLPSTDEEWGALLQRSGMSRNGVDTAISEYARMREYNRVQSELGLLGKPRENEQGELLDKDGNVVTDPAEAQMIRVTPEEVDASSAEQFSYSIPELVMSDESRLDAQLRAAAYRQFVQQQMGPQMELQKATADVYGQLLGNARLPAEYQAILPQTTRLFDAANTLEADAMMQQMMMLPEMQAIQGQMSQDQALQQALQGLAIQEGVAAEKAMYPERYPYSTQSAIDPFGLSAILDPDVLNSNVGA